MKSIETSQTPIGTQLLHITSAKVTNNKPSVPVKNTPQLSIPDVMNTSPPINIQPSDMSNQRNPHLVARNKKEKKV